MVVVPNAASDEKEAREGREGEIKKAVSIKMV